MKRNGRPPFEPTNSQRQIVQVLRANGIAVGVIAANVRCSVPTLRRHFKAELRDGHEQTKAAMGAAVVKAGLAGNMFAARYWLSCHGGPEWRAIEARQISGTLGTDLSAVSTEALEQELAALRRKQAAAEHKWVPIGDEPPESIH